MLGNVSAVQTANFEGIGGVLSLAPPDFLGAIGNFAGGDVIDLQNTRAAAASFGADLLVVTLSTGSTIALATTSTFTGR